MELLEFLPKPLLDGLHAAKRRQARRGSRLHIRAGDAVFPVLRQWKGGFSLDADKAPHLRGLVDLYDGPRHLLQGLIVVSREEDGEIRCEYKSFTRASEAQPVDFWQGENAPRGFLGHIPAE